jgi:hypothetical protein
VRLCQEQEAGEPSDRPARRGVEVVAEHVLPPTVDLEVALAPVEFDDEAVVVDVDPGSAVPGLPTWRGKPMTAANVFVADLDEALGTVAAHPEHIAEKCQAGQRAAAVEHC